MKCKKEIMGIAALLIIVFHFWILLSSNAVELCIYKSSYIGVDLFFFISGYSLSKRNSIKYFDFVKNRIINVYLPFVILTIIFALYKRIKLIRFIEILVGIEFLKKGGGAFLWFVTGIMIFYLLAPYLVHLKNKYGMKSFIIFIVAWLVLVLTLQFGFKYTTIFILVNRLPIFIIGMFYEKIRQIILNKKNAIYMICIGIILGGMLVYKYCGNIKLNKPLTDFYYVLVIPFVLSFVLLMDYFSDEFNMESKFLKCIGSITLELYGLQMIFGYTIESKLLDVLNKTTLPFNGMKFLAFMGTLIILLVIGFGYKMILDVIKSVIKGLVNNEKENVN